MTTHTYLQFDFDFTEQKQEKDFLQERSVQLKNKLQDIKREAEYLSQKMAVSSLIHN